MLERRKFRWRRPLIWALLVLLAGAIISIWAPAEAQPPRLLPSSQRADRVLIEKAERRLTLYRGGQVLKIYPIVLGFAPAGDKAREGDGRTPEGVYRIDRRNRQSSFYLSLGIDYPRPDQRAAARREGRHPGGDIFIHGQPHRRSGVPAIPYDWTAGCAALSNEQIAEIWARVAIGTRVEIVP